jgi:hypothetical protein
LRELENEYNKEIIEEKDNNCNKIIVKLVEELTTNEDLNRNKKSKDINKRKTISKSFDFINNSNEKVDEKQINRQISRRIGIIGERNIWNKNFSTNCVNKENEEKENSLNI